MAYSTTAQGGAITYDVREFTCDTIADKDALPTDCAVGSSCIVLENSSVWVLGSDKVWHQL